MWPNKIKQQTWCHDAIVDVDGRCSILSPCKSARESIVCWHFYQHTLERCVHRHFARPNISPHGHGCRDAGIPGDQAPGAGSQNQCQPSWPWQCWPFLRYIKRARLGPDSFVRWKVRPGRIIHVNTRRKSECVHGNKKLEKNLKRKCEKVELCDRFDLC